MTKFEEELMATAKMIPTSDGNEIKFKTSSALYDYLLLSNGEAELYLQQQALPVVPEFVGIWIKKCQELNWMITDVLAPESWSSDFAKDTEKWLKDSKENFNLLALAFITGKYEVEKPQLFRLKLKNTPISNYYLWLNQATGKVFVDKKFLDWTNHDNVKNIFTEQEIPKISDGAFVNNEAFELVPVEDGE